MSQKNLSVTMSDVDTSSQFFPRCVELKRLTATQRAIVDAVRLQAIAAAETLSDGTIVRDEEHALKYLLEQLDAAPPASQTLTAAATEGDGNSITAGVRSIEVEGVTNDSDDFVSLPAIANVADGFTISISAEAGSNFELRTPAGSGTEINSVIADGSAEYLCSDGDRILATKFGENAWVACSITSAGAVRSEVSPD